MYTHTWVGGRYSFHKFCDTREPCLTRCLLFINMRDGSMSLPPQRTFKFQRSSYTAQCLIVQLRLPIKLYPSCFSLRRSGITAVCHPTQIILGFLLGFVVLDDPTHVLLASAPLLSHRPRLFRIFFKVELCSWLCGKSTCSASMRTQIHISRTHVEISSGYSRLL